MGINVQRVKFSFVLRMPPPRTPEMGGYGGGDDMRGGGGGHMNYDGDRGYPPTERYH